MKQRDKIILAVLALLLVGSIVAVYFTYNTYQSSYAKDAKVRKEMETEKAVITSSRKEIAEQSAYLQKLKLELEDLQKKIYLRDVHYSTYAMPATRVKGNTIFYARNSWELYSGKLDGGKLELVHSLSEKDRLLDYEFTDSGYYMLVYEVGSVEQKFAEPVIELYLGKMGSRSVKRVRQLNVEQGQELSGYRYQGMRISPDEQYLVVLEEVGERSTFKVLELKDLSPVDVVKDLTKQNITLGESLRFLSFGGKDTILFESVKENDPCLHRYNVNVGTYDSLILASIRGTYYQIDPATGNGFVTGRSISTGAAFYFALSAEAFGDNGIGQFWD